MRRIVATLAAGAVLVSPTAASAVELETQALLQSQVLRLKTTDDIRLHNAYCRPSGLHYAINNGGQLFGDQWTCYVSDNLKRFYNLDADVRNTSAGGISKLTVLSCDRTFSKFACPSGAKIALPAT
jgi:hypothetical protein